MSLTDPLTEAERLGADKATLQAAIAQTGANLKQIASALAQGFQRVKQSPRNAEMMREAAEALAVVASAASHFDKLVSSANPKDATP